MTMARYRTMMVLLVSVGTLFRGCDSDVKCRDDEGNEVDWYYIYKFPKKNLSYLYMDESTNGWKLSEETINSTSGTLANTLKPLFEYYDKKTEGFGYLLYNDQPPNARAAAASFGHSKGVVMLDEQTGVWLSHSTPKCPTKRSKYFWPDSGNANAQTFMCVTYSYAQFKNIGWQLWHIRAYPYDRHIPKTFPKELHDVANRRRIPKGYLWFPVTLTSMKGSHFSSFAKSKHFHDDLYSGLIVGHLKQNLYVKSWGKYGSAALSSNCSADIPHHVYNVKEVRLLNGEPFKDTVDHSKWCVTCVGNWTCIADMNREESQMKRGGGAICTENEEVAKAFITIIKGYEKCELELPHSDAQDREH